MRSLKLSVICITTVILLFSAGFTHAASNQSTTAAELVQDEKVVYTLPDVGNILPTHPLFILKQLRDELQTVVTLDPYEKLKLKLKLSDRYIAYAQALAELNKPTRTMELVRQAVNYQYEAYTLISGISLKESVNSAEVQETRFVFIQANIKQAEIMRTLLTKLPKGEQEELLSLLDKNISLKKDLQDLK